MSRQGAAVGALITSAVLPVTAIAHVHPRYLEVILILFTKAKFIYLYFLFGLLVYFSSSTTILAKVLVDKKDTVLIIGKPIKVKLISSSNHGDVRSLTVSNDYKVRLKIIDVIEGTIKKKSIDIVLAAAHKGYIGSSESIFVLLDYTDQVPSVLYWGVPKTIACIPIGSSSLNKYIESLTIYDSHMRAKCIDVNAVSY